MREGSRPTPKHVGMVHEWLVYRREVTRTPFRALAAEIGIPKSTVEKFYKEKFRPSKVWPQLRDWYMRDRQSRHSGYRTPPEEVAMSIVRMLDDFPAAMRGEAPLSGGHLPRDVRGREAALPGVGRDARRARG